MKQKAEIDSAKCISCMHCRSICSRIGAKAISITWRPDHEQAPWFVENALGVIQSIGAEKFYYINLAIDISDKCDCWNVGPTLLVHDIGIFGSHDPVAVDQACLDAVNRAEPNPDSIVSRVERGGDKFTVAHDSKDPKTGKALHLAEIQLDHAEKMGLGKRDYELITLTKAQPKGYSPF